MTKIKDPYLTIINARVSYNKEDFKNFEYEKVAVTDGDWGKKTSFIEKNTKQSFDLVLQEFDKLGIKCNLISAGRSFVDQIYAQGETFAIKLNNQAKKELEDKKSSVSLPKKVLAIVKNPKLIKIAYGHQKKYAARIGHSEHHSGLAIDIKVDMTNVKIPDKIKEKYPDANNGLLNFLTRRLVMEKFGFIQTYPQSPRIETVTGMPEAEAWHWRYVGPEHSQRIAHLRDKVGQDVFLEDYVKLLQYDIKAENEKDLLNQYADLFINEILVHEKENNQTL